MKRAERDAAYSEFVRARYPVLRRIAYAVCGDWVQAEDLTQTALVKLYVAWPRLAQVDNIEAYARTVIMRAGVDESRRPWRRRERAGLPTTDEAARAALGPEDRDELLDALLALPLMQRKAVVLRHWLGLSVEETAAELGVTAGTVKSHTSRGLAALRVTLGADLVAEGAP